MFDVMELQMRDEKSPALSRIERCKNLARVLKNQRAPPGGRPFPPINELPDKSVCNALIDPYIHTTASLYRIPHIPSFKQRYESIWQPESTPTPGFLTQLKLVLAIGAVAHDDTYSPRSPAVRWVCEAQTYLSEPEFKLRLTSQSLQILILLLFARQMTNIGGSVVWILAGELLRTAMDMGLNRDAGAWPRTSRIACEMQRKLWSTVLESVLQTSMDSGGPPLISMTDFDTLSPRNIWDDQLPVEDSPVVADRDYTATSVARALRSMFATRLATVKHLNDLDVKRIYEEAIKLDKELRACHKAMARTLEAIRSPAHPASFDTGSDSPTSS